MKQGDEYRNALDASQRRIEMLERELQVARSALPEPPRGTPGWVSVLAIFGGLGVGMFLLGIGAMVVSTLAASHHVDSNNAPPYDPAPPATEYKPLLGASWYTGRNEGPKIEVDVDGDGDQDIISLFWRAPEDTSLFVAAVDRDTMKAIWTAGPYPSQWSGPHTHLVVTGNHVMVSDSRETLHVLDVKTGNTVHDLPFEGGAQSACQIAATPHLIRLDRSYSDYAVLDPAAGTLRPTTSLEKLGCVGEHADCKHARPGQACYVDDPGAAGRSKVKGFSAYGSTVEHDRRFTEGTVVSENGKQRDQWLMMSDAKGKKLLWTAPAVLEGDTLHIAGRLTTQVTDKAVISFYQRSLGDFRMVARSGETGELLWSQSIAGTNEGSWAELFVEGGELLVDADHRMHLYDLDSGTELHVSSGI